MPRVTIKKMDYKKKDLKSWIIGQAHARGLKQEDVARELGISQQALSRRLKFQKKGRESDPFRYGDLLVLFDLFETTDEEKLNLLKS